MFKDRKLALLLKIKWKDNLFQQLAREWAFTIGFPSLKFHASRVVCIVYSVEFFSCYYWSSSLVLFRFY